MARFPNSFGPRGAGGFGGYNERAGASSPAITSFFNAVYAWMAVGLAVTASVAWWVASQPDLMARVLSGPVLILCVIVELVLVFTVANAIRRINTTVATLLFLLYSALNGLTLSVIFLVYAHSVLASAFIVSAGTFGVMSVYGMVTRRDLSGWGNLLFMGLIGIVIASIVSMFWHNTMLGVLINYVGVLVFVGLTAYDTQRLKETAWQTQGDAALASRLSVTGALMLYLDFINLFLFILRIMGDRNNR